MGAFSGAAGKSAVVLRIEPRQKRRVSPLGDSPSGFHPRSTSTQPLPGGLTATCA